MTSALPYRIKTITDYHRLTELPPPEHPLISVVNVAALTPPVMDVEGPVSLVFDFYCISLKRVPNTRFRYGQQACDFDEGVLFFMAPGQVISFEIDKSSPHRPSGWMLFIHPDFLWHTPLANLSKQYEYFGYSVHEGLYLSAKEEALLTGIAHSLAQEYCANLDKFSHRIIVSQLGSLLQYAERFYERQFRTRRVTSHQLLDRLEELLAAYFENEARRRTGLPTVGFLAESLHVSPDYLSSLLKALTGLNTQQHIHQKLIDKAKEKLSTTGLSVSEIAYQLGFGYPQSFSKLFKTKTNQSPLEFRQSFN